MSRLSMMMPAVLVGLSSAGIGGDITGRVTLEGTPPDEVVLPLDPLCRNTRPGEKPTTRFYVVDEDANLADVFVVVRGIEGDFPVPEQPVILDQVGCEYVPYVLAARAGQTIEVRNSDPLLHNVHPTPRVEGNPERNLAQLGTPLGKPLDFVFEKPETFLRFKCDVHPWMFAYVSIVEHPFFAVTGTDGTFTIEDVPPGEYEIAAIHRKAHAPDFEGIVKRITVGEGEAKMDFVVDITE